MTDWSYRDALSKRPLDAPALLPPADPLWQYIAFERLARAWVAGHVELTNRWQRQARIGEWPATFEHTGDHVTVTIAGVAVSSVAVAELL